MARWEPDPRGRLIRAALELFSTQGYAATTTGQIAEKAGLTKTTFFRHFSDKREPLFYGQATLIELAVDGVTTAPQDAGPLDAVGAGLYAMTAAFGPEQRAYAQLLQSVIAANVELLERAAFKRAAVAAAIAGALHDRGVAEPVASLAAELGTRAFYSAYGPWAEPANTRSFPDIAREVLDELRVGAAALAG